AGNAGIPEQVGAGVQVESCKHIDIVISTVQVYVIEGCADQTGLHVHHHGHAAAQVHGVEVGCNRGAVHAHVIQADACCQSDSGTELEVSFHKDAGNVPSC